MVTIAAVLGVGLLVWWWVDQQIAEPDSMPIDPPQVVDSSVAQEKPTTTQEMDRQPPPVLSGVPLTVVTDPEDVQVTIIGVSEPYRDGLLLPPGEYAFVVSAPGHKPVERTIQLNADNLRFVVDLPLASYARAMQGEQLSRQVIRIGLLHGQVRRELQGRHPDDEQPGRPGQAWPFLHGIYCPPWSR